MQVVIGIVGLGAMGLGIAQVYALAGFSVIATDAHEPVRTGAKARLAKSLEMRMAQGKLAAAECDKALAQFTVVENLKGLANADLVVEAIVEDLEAKRMLIGALENIVSASAVLSTNTSSLSVAAIADCMRHPERGLGLHFFNPAPAMKLVELVAHAGTSSAALAMARMVTEAAGKTVIACADRPGFIVNRCARPFYGEALALLEEGRSASDIDAAMLAAGYRLGPLSLIDLIGADVHLAATEGVYEAMDRHPRYHVFGALKGAVAQGTLGRKSGHGFVFPEKPGGPPPDGPAIALRIEAALANEAASLVGEGDVSADHIDTAMKLGLNFPRGPFESARRWGLSAVRAELERCEANAPPALKGRYQISPALVQMR